MHTEEWKRAKDDLVDASGRPVSKRANPNDRPDRLFHFTDSAGLIGILGKKCLRASLAPSLNDASEVAHGLACARDRIDGYMGPVDRDFVAMIGRLLDLSNVPVAYRIELHAYVISFCAGDDNALHWLHYGRSGTGVAIAFDGTAVQKRPFDLFRVVYDPDEQRALVDSVIEATAGCLLRNVEQLQGAEARDLTEVAAHLAAGRLRAVAPLMKHPGFETEREWRLVTHDVKGERVTSEHMLPLPMDYRVVANRVVPYQELVFDHLPAKELVLGFSCAMACDDQGLADLMQNSCAKLEVRRSTVPVRP